MSNVESVSVSSLAQIADAYDGTISDSYSWGLTDTFPAADVTETEDKVIADIFPVTDTIAGDLTDTGIKDDTVTGDGTGTSTKDDTITDSGTDTGTDSGIISLWDTLWGWLKKILNALFDIVSALLNLANDIAEAILGPLIESLADLLKTLFVPDMTAFESQLSLISAKFAWISTLFNSIKSIRGFIASSASSIPPSIYMNFSSAESSKYNSIGNVAFIDASWYAPYKSNGDAILSAFLWFAFIWRLFKKIPSVLNGLSMTSDKDID